MSSYAQKLQKLHVELYFNRSLMNDFGERAEDILNENGLEISALAKMPDVYSENFSVESYGRKYLILKEVFKRFKQFFSRYLACDEVKIEDVLESDIFVAYLESEFFFW